MPISILPPSFARFRQIRVYLILISTILSIMILGIFGYLNHLTTLTMERRLYDEARSYAQLLLDVKRWNYEEGGVYARPRPDDPTPGYLSSFGIAPEIATNDGRRFVIKNHAIMLTEISRLSEQRDGVSFRLISLEPIDPRNKPDLFEHDGLHFLSAGAKEYARLISDPPPRYRLLLPLPAEQNCLACHPAHHEGDIIGAISISIPAEVVLAETRSTRTFLIVTSTMILGSVLVILYLLTLRLSNQIDAVNLKLHRQATTDELTGLRNRRKILRRLEEEFSRSARLEEPLSVIVFDIDHFKKINDTYGHQFGDLVLRRVAQLLQETVRTYDLVGRIGGEEFLVVTPATTRDEAYAIAERIRLAVAAEPVGNESMMVHVTVSGGVSTMNRSEDSINALVKRADDALYAAKNGGRNRVVAR